MRLCLFAPVVAHCGLLPGTSVFELKGGERLRPFTPRGDVSLCHPPTRLVFAGFVMPVCVAHGMGSPLFRVACYCGLLQRCFALPPPSFANSSHRRRRASGWWRRASRTHRVWTRCHRWWRGFLNIPSRMTKYEFVYMGKLATAFLCAGAAQLLALLWDRDSIASWLVLRSDCFGAFPCSLAPKAEPICA